MKQLIKQLNGLIVSCQALEGEPLHGSEIMAAMAAAAEMGGATAIRANSPQDIAAIKRVTSLPVIGLYKQEYDDAEVYITPTMREIELVAEAGADYVAIDFTNMTRPHGETLEELVPKIKSQFPELIIVADVSTFEEGMHAVQLGAHVVSTTMSGYTPHSPQQTDPDIELVRKLAAATSTPVLAEGRMWSAEQCIQCFEAGAYGVVVGTAITRPQEIVKRYVTHINKQRQIN